MTSSDCTTAWGSRSADFNIYVWENQIRTVTGKNNTGFGYRVLTNAASPDNNTVIGQDVLSNATLGSNVVIGKNILNAVTNASQTVAIGYDLFNTVTGGGGGAQNVFIGKGTGYASGGADGRVVIGSGNLNVSAANTVYLGSDTTTIMRMRLPTYASADNIYPSALTAVVGALFRQGNTILYYRYIPNFGVFAVIKYWSPYRIYQFVPGNNFSVTTAVPSCPGPGLISSDKYAVYKIASITPRTLKAGVATAPVSINSSAGQVSAALVLLYQQAGTSPPQDVWNGSFVNNFENYNVVAPTNVLNIDTTVTPNVQVLNSANMVLAIPGKPATLQIAPSYRFPVALGDTYHVAVVLKFSPLTIAPTGQVVSFNTSFLNTIEFTNGAYKNLD